MQVLSFWPQYPSEKGTVGWCRETQALVLPLVWHMGSRYSGLQRGEPASTVVGTVPEMPGVAQALLWRTQYIAHGVADQHASGASKTAASPWIAASNEEGW